MKRLGPGAYEDEKGCLHIDAIELCLHLKLKPTAEAQDMVTRLVCEAMAKQSPETVIEVHDNPAWPSTGDPRRN